MSHLARELAERGAEAPLAGMRPWSWLQGAGVPVSYARLRGQIPSKLGPLFRSPTRPASAGIDSKANALSCRHDLLDSVASLEEAARMSFLASAVMSIPVPPAAAA